MTTRIGVMVLATAFWAGGACKKKESPSEKEPDPPATAARGGGGAGFTPLPAGAGRPPAVRRALATITSEEVKDRLPELASARVIKPLQKARVGERIEKVVCVDEGEIDQVAARVEDALLGAGWQHVAVRAHPKLPDRYRVEGRDPPYFLTGSILRGKWSDCMGERGQTWVALGVHKLEPGSDPGGSRAGPSGPAQLEHVPGSATE